MTLLLITAPPITILYIEEALEEALEEQPASAQEENNATITEIDQSQQQVESPPQVQPIEPPSEESRPRRRVHIIRRMEIEGVGTLVQIQRRRTEREESEDEFSVLDILRLVHSARAKRGTPLTKEQFKAIPETKFNPEGQGPEAKKPECTICMTEFERNQKIKVLNCTHSFHKKCIKPWFANANTCPCCRNIVE